MCLLQFLLQISLLSFSNYCLYDCLQFTKIALQCFIVLSSFLMMSELYTNVSLDQQAKFSFGFNIFAVRIAEYIKSSIIFAVLHPKRVTCLRGPSPRHCARATLPVSKKMSQRWRAVGNTVSDLTGPRFEPQLPTNCLVIICLGW